MVNGIFDVSRGTTYQSVARYICNEGYQLVGIPLVTCQEDEQWSGPSPTCMSKKYYAYVVVYTYVRTYVCHIL